MPKFMLMFALGAVLASAAFADMDEPPDHSSGVIYGDFEYADLVVDAGGITYLRLLSKPTWEHRWIWIDATTDAGLVQAVDIIKAKQANNKNFAFSYAVSTTRTVPISGGTAYLKLKALQYK